MPEAGPSCAWIKDLSCRDRARDSGFQQKKRKKFFTMRVVNYNMRLPRETVDVPTLEEVKAWLDGTLKT